MKFGLHNSEIWSEWPAENKIYELGSSFDGKGNQYESNLPSGRTNVYESELFSSFSAHWRAYIGWNSLNFS